jgi:16S rRNA (cytidine1402-2'-O)-methyltransferase
VEQLEEVMGEAREVAVSREITKMFEETVRGTLAEVAEHFRQQTPKGEFVIVVAGNKTKDERRERRDEE